MTFSVVPLDTTTGGGTHLRIPAGAHCQRCDATEQQCAYKGGCCQPCSHWTGYDAHGNPPIPQQGRRKHRHLTVVAPLPARARRAFELLAGGR